MTSVSPAGTTYPRGRRTLSVDLDVRVEILDNQLPLLARFEIDDSHPNGGPSWVGDIVHDQGHLCRDALRR